MEKMKKKILESDQNQCPRKSSTTVSTSLFSFKMKNNFFYLALCLPLALLIGKIHPKIKVLSSFIKFHVVLNMQPMIFFLLWNTKEGNLSYNSLLLCGKRYNESEWRMRLSVPILLYFTEKRKLYGFKNEVNDDNVNYWKNDPLLSTALVLLFSEEGTVVPSILKKPVLQSLIYSCPTEQNSFLFSFTCVLYICVYEAFILTAIF